MARPATQHESRKAAIVDAALDCFARHGYDGATNKIIAEAAGMKSAAIIYHYFPSKEDLFQACLERLNVFDTLHAILEEHQHEPPDVFLRMVGTAYLRLVREDQRVIKLMMMVLSSIHSHPELLLLALRRVVPAFLLPLLAYLHRQEETGTLRKLPPMNAGLQFFAPLIFRAVTSQLPPALLPVPQTNDEEFVESLVQTFLDGARGDSSASR